MATSKNTKSTEGAIKSDAQLDTATTPTDETSDVDSRLPADVYDPTAIIDYPPAAIDATLTEAPIDEEEQTQPSAESVEDRSNNTNHPSIPTDALFATNEADLPDYFRQNNLLFFKRKLGIPKNSKIDLWYQPVWKPAEVEAVITIVNAHQKIQALGWEIPLI